MSLDQDKKNLENMTADEILDRLKAGNKRFQEDQLEHPLQDQERREALVEGQSPYAIILSCADSRVAPEVTFDVGLGEIFVVRVAGNVANPSSLASIEYAVANIGSKVIVVMGHESCGAVKAAMDSGSTDLGPNLNHLLDFIKPVCKEGATVKETVDANVAKTINDMQQNSSIIKDAIDNGKVKVVGAYYNLTDGKVDFDEAVA